MGICGSAELTAEQKKKLEEDRVRNKNLDMKLRDDFTNDQRVYKLLLLGAGESGKSTLFKQMITIYGKGFPVEERKNYTSIVFNNVISSMKVLCQNLPRYASVLPENQASYEAFFELKDEIVDERVGSIIARLWEDPGIRITYDHRADFQLNDSAEYFFERINDVMSRDYVPSEQDVLRSRVRTTGIVENEFVIDKNCFKMFDVGGQRNERKKWIHCFEGVTAVIFVAAISEYDQKLYEDESTNRMTEAFKLFEEICNSRWFRETSMLLFLNKRDLFNTKIMKVNLSEHFHEFPGPDHNPVAAQEWIREQFMSKNKNPQQTIYPHVTCATDTNNIESVFSAVKDIVIRNSLRMAGLLS